MVPKGDPASCQWTPLGLSDSRLALFPNKFPNRKLKSSGKTVRQHDELIEYIMEKAREVNLLKHTSNSNKTMVYVVKEQTIDTIPGPCNVAIYGNYYVKEKV